MAKNEKANLDILKFEGTKIELGGKFYILPPLPISVLHKSGFYQIQQSLIEKSGSTDALAEVGELTYKCLEFIFLGLQRNYPDVKREDTTDLIGVSELKKIMPALIDIQDADPKNV